MEKKAKAVYDALVRAMDKLDMKYECVGDGEFVFNFEGDDLPMSFKMKIDEKRELVVLLSVLPFKIKSENILGAAIAAGQINYLLMDGSFDIDIDDGSAAFRMTSSFRDSLVSEISLQYMIACSVHTVDKFNDKLFMISEGALDAEEFVRSL